MIRPLSLLALVPLGLVGCKLLPGDDPVKGDAPFIAKPVRVDACGNDLFFVDLPLEADADLMPPDFPARLATALTETAQANVHWFCDPGRCDALAVEDRLVARVAPVLAGPEAARFLRVGFYYRPAPESGTPWADAERLWVRDDSVCDAVTALHATLDVLTGLPDHPFYAGRACTASGQQVAPGEAPDLTQAMLDWHLDQLGIDAPFDARVPIVLVDTGVQPDVVGGVRPVAVPGEALPARFDGAGQPVPVAPANRHPHGTEMAVAMRQITTAPILDLPALGRDGRVPLGQVARAVEATVAALGDDPAVINLSLGWAPEVERERKLIRGACRTAESPAGEAMRAVLAHVYAEHTNQLVVAAGGNRAFIGDAYRQTFSGRVQAGAFGDALETDAFYPAQWGLRGTAISGSPRPTVLAVGAARSTGGPAGLDQRRALLYAPGEHVYLTADGEAPAACGAGGEVAVTFPRAVTGSSVAAALTSALATRVLEAVPDLKTAQFARLLYLAGVPMGVEAGEALVPQLGLHELPMRRLHAGRLERLLADPMPALAACRGTAPALTGPAPTADCVAALEARGLDETLQGPEPAVTWAGPREPICDSPVVDGAALELAPSAGRICEEATPPPTCAVADLYSAGDAGPQPEHNGCDDCALLVNLGEETMRLQGILSTALPTDTEITNPWIIAYWSTGEKAVLDLGGLDQVWAPGKALDIAGLKLDLGGLELAKADVFLSTSIKTPDQTSATNDMSPLRVGED